MFEQGDQKSGGNFEIKPNGDLQSEPMLQSLLYYSLFCGESPLNAIRRDDQNHSSAFEFATNKKITTTMLEELQRHATTQTQWLIQAGFAKTIEISVSVAGVEDVKIIASIGTIRGTETFEFIV